MSEEVQRNEEANYVARSPIDVFTAGQVTGFASYGDQLIPHLLCQLRYQDCAPPRHWAVMPFHPLELSGMTSK